VRISGAVPLAGTDVPVLRSFGYFKLTVVLEGIYARYSQHQKVGVGFEHEGLAVPTLVARAHQVLDADD
jgi:hypothetical protein